jgi:hypothetical protein
MKNIKTYEDFVNEEISLKKALATGALATGMAFSNPAKSQITTTSVPKPIAKEIIQTPYDSTRNSVGDDIGSLIGQELYLTHISYGEELYLNIKDFGKSSINPSMVEKKYYKLINVSEDTTHRDYQKSNINYYILKLQEVNSKNIYYQRYNNKQSGFPFIVIGFYEKIKKMYIGSILKFKWNYGWRSDGDGLSVISSLENSFNIWNRPDYNKPWGSIDPANWQAGGVSKLKGYPTLSKYVKISNDLKTGRYISDLEGDWICKDVTIDDSQNLVLIFENGDKSFFIKYNDLVE